MYTSTRDTFKLTSNPYAFFPPLFSSSLSEFVLICFFSSSTRSASAGVLDLVLPASESSELESRFLCLLLLFSVSLWRLCFELSSESESDCFESLLCLLLLPASLSDEPEDLLCFFFSRIAKYFLTMSSSSESESSESRFFLCFLSFLFFFFFFLSSSAFFSSYKKGNIIRQFYKCVGITRTNIISYVGTWDSIRLSYPFLWCL